jgi:hypothetical protein
MKAEDAMRHPPEVLGEAQRRRYFSNAYLVLPDYVPEPWLDRLRRATAELLGRSREVTRSDDVFVVEEGHSAADPRLRTPWAYQKSEEDRRRQRSH